MSHPNESHCIKHVVLIPDGNGRWAELNGLPTRQGHIRGLQAIENFLEVCRDCDIEVVTLWAFSTENWTRSDKEVRDIMTLVNRKLSSLIKRTNKEDKKYRFIHIGRKSMIAERFPELLKNIEKLEKDTKDNLPFTLNLALDYGGRDEVIRAVNKLISKGISEDKISFKDLEAHLDTGGQPDPDLIIRTSGEKRLSGIFPMQSVYAEFYFEPAFLPDFTKEKAISAFQDFCQRERRRGGRSK